MKLYVRPTSCDEKVRVKSSAATRPELQMEKGDEFTINCPESGKIVKVHVNDVMAEVNKAVILIGLIIGVGVTIVLWKYFGAIGTISGIIPLLFWRQEMNSVKTFNSFLIKRK